ncbi:MAG: hypothetical protein ACTSSH_13485 [Candidatus Heimdallarchaeota archaeon]
MTYEVFHDSTQLLSEDNLEQEIVRCTKCGFPLYTESALGDTESTEQLTQHQRTTVCSICRRERRLNAVLIGSYVLFGAIFIVCIIGIILDQMTINVTLMIGCLEIIFLLFFGRFLEDAVFFGLADKDKVLAALYRFSVSGELQAFDLALGYLHKYHSLEDEDLIKGLLQVTAYQAKNLPAVWFSETSQILDMKVQEFINLLSSEIDEIKGSKYSREIIEKTPPEGISLLMEILIIGNNENGLKIVASRLSKELAQEELSKNWLNEFYIYKHNYQRALKIIGREDIYTSIEEKLETHKESRVPSIDVIESSKNLIQRNPIFRFLFRIFFYILLAFVLGLLYRLLD